MDGTDVQFSEIGQPKEGVIFEVEDQVIFKFPAQSSDAILD